MSLPFAACILIAFSAADWRLVDIKTWRPNFEKSK